LIKFERMEIRSFLSWKKLDVSFENRGHVFVFGKNGNGKSGIAAALKWCLYAKTGRDIRSDSVINSSLSSGCRVSTWFTSPSGKIRVDRYRKHPKFGDGFRLRRAGKDITCATIPATQRRLDSILGFKRVGFGNSILFDPNSQELFSQGTDATQKAILKDLLGLDIFSKCKKITANRERKINLELAETRVEGRDYSDRLDDAKARYGELVEMRKQAHKKQKQKLTKYKVRFAVNENKLAKLRVLLDSRREYQDKQSTLIENCQADLRVFEVENKKFVKMMNSGKCFFCDQKLNVKNFTAKKITLHEKMSTAKKTLSLCRTKLQWAKERVATVWDKVQKINNKKLRLQTLIAEETGSEIDYKKLLTDGKIEMNTLTRHVVKLRKKAVELTGLHAQLMFWVKGFGTYGIERFALSKVLPILNQRVKAYLDQMPTENGVIEYVLDLGEDGRLSACVTFDGRTGGYTQLSMGERRRVDVACQLALHDLVGSEINLLIIDELLTNMDDDGVDAAMGVFHNLKKESIFVISHDARLREQFTNVMEIARDKQGFSVIR